MALEVSPAFIQANTYSAEITRRATTGLLQARGSSIGSVAGGFVNVAAGDLLMAAPVSGMSVNVAPGECVVPGTTSTTQSGYYLFNASTTNLSISTANPTNPRIDLVCATINDASYAGALNSGVLQVVTGTPTSGATLINLSGAPSLPTSSLLIGYVLVPAAASNIVAGDLGDKRVQLAGVITFNGRSGAVVPAVGDYLAVPSGGLTGAVAATRYVGGTTSGAPVSGIFLKGDFVIDQTAFIWVCTTAGSPGTWTALGGSGVLASHHFAPGSVTASAVFGTTAFAVLDAANFIVPTFALPASGKAAVVISATFGSATAHNPYLALFQHGSTTKFGPSVCLDTGAAATEEHVFTATFVITGSPGATIPALDLYGYDGAGAWKIQCVDPGGSTTVAPSAGAFAPFDSIVYALV